jgi:hypothetical protein
MPFTILPGIIQLAVPFLIDPGPEDGEIGVAAATIANESALLKCAPRRLGNRFCR